MWYTLPLLTLYEALEAPQIGIDSCLVGTLAWFAHDYTDVLLGRIIAESIGYRVGIGCTIQGTAHGGVVHLVSFLPGGLNIGC